jgi:hypothetical protein
LKPGSGKQKAVPFELYRKLNDESGKSAKVELIYTTTHCFVISRLRALYEVLALNIGYKKIFITILFP